MIDLGRIRRWAGKVEGNHVALSKEQLSTMIAEIEAGRQARRELASHVAFGQFAAEITR